MVELWHDVILIIIHFKHGGLLGLNPSENYFHCQGGREGLVNISVKTSNDGCIQRHILKSMQDIFTQYDGTISDGTDIVQFCY
jgi:DNA-directed RNA polymerase beta' subunit